jgi:hypothetical protein
LTTVVPVTVPSMDGVFQTGQAQVSAVLVVQQSKVKEARDSALLQVRPSLSVRLADVAVLEGAARPCGSMSR